jgi:hypothetical protein
VAAWNIRSASSLYNETASWLQDVATRTKSPIPSVIPLTSWKRY